MTKATHELADGRYRVMEQLGRGGMGAVYRVIDQPTGRELALKRLTRDEPSFELRFRREFHQVAGLRHPRIVEVYSYGRDERGAFYTMELLSGKDLSMLGPAPVDEACLLLRDVASALAFLHARRLLHRDLAPRNVRCTVQGTAKLMDFGLIATHGISGDVAGTPPFLAPESLRGQPLDHRADLFGLGALSYWLLTGRNAFPARTLKELEDAWKRRPPPPSSIAPAVPSSLDELVAALLSLDPVGRPASAAEVIDRLGAVAKLEPAPEMEVARGYLASAPLVGRSREIGRVKKMLARAVAGTGGAVLVEAAAGTGKSRLLREVRLEAQVAGATVIAADGESDPRGPYGLLRELVRELLAAAPDESLASARDRGSVLLRVLPELRPWLPDVAVERPHGDPAQDRMRLQTELAAWIEQIARARPLALLVDDVQRCDEATAAVLASLAHVAKTCPLFLGVARRTGEEVRAPAAVASFRDAGLVIRLQGLAEADVLELVQSLFGDVRHGARLAAWMSRVAGGSPLYCAELARHLVEQGAVRYAAGTWVLPEEVGALGALPAGLADAMDARVRALSPLARELAEVLGVHGGALALADIVVLGGEATENEVFGALDELVRREVLVGSDQGYRFQHDVLREAVLRGLDDARKRSLHLRIAEALSSNVAEEQEGFVGWHFFRAGEELRGAELLERAGRRTFAAQSFSDSVPALEAVIGAYERAGVSTRRCLELRRLLVVAGTMCDREVVLRYGPGTIATLERGAGLLIARKVGRVLGRPLGLVVGLACAGLGRLFTRARRRGPPARQALQEVFILVSYTASAFSLAFDTGSLRSLLKVLWPVAFLEQRVPHGAYLAAENFLAIPLGQWAKVRRNAHRALEILETDHLTPLSPTDRVNAVGALHFMLTSADVMQHDPAYLVPLAALEALDSRFFEVCARMARLYFHRWRGEEEEALQIEAQVEVDFVKLGSMWILDSQRAWMSSMAYGLTRDVLGLRRSLEDLTRLVDAGYRLEPFLELARGEYARERGELTASLSALQRGLSLLEPEDSFRRFPLLAALAETHLAAQDLDRAAEVASQGFALASDPERASTPYRARCGRTLALVRAARAELDEAGRSLESLLADVAGHDSPTLSGMLHEARARVALLANDRIAYEAHRLSTDRCFRPTRNPALVARSDRLEAAGRSAAELGEDATDQMEAIEILAADAVTMRAGPVGSKWVSAELGRCRGSAERSTKALELIVQASGASHGWLYLRTPEGLRLAAPLGGDEPPTQVNDAISRAVQEAVSEDDATIADDDASLDGRHGHMTWRPLVLQLQLGGRLVPIGAVALVHGEGGLLDPDARGIEEIARRLYEAGDVTTGA